MVIIVDGAARCCVSGAPAVLALVAIVQDAADLSRNTLKNTQYYRSKHHHAPKLETAKIQIGRVGLYRTPKQNRCY